MELLITPKNMLRIGQKYLDYNDSFDRIDDEVGKGGEE